MYSQNHYQFFQRTNSKYQTWGADAFHPECLFERKTVATPPTTYYTPGSRGDANKHANANRYMPSLAAMGLPTYKYTDASVAALTPTPL
jgi:hypothetical protein